MTENTDESPVVDMSDDDGVLETRGQTRTHFMCMASDLVGADIMQLMSSFHLFRPQSLTQITNSHGLTSLYLLTDTLCIDRGSRPLVRS